MHQPNTLKLHIDESCEYRLRREMPWIFSKYADFEKQSPNIGDLVAIYGKKNQCIKLGLYDPYSPISVRILGNPCQFSLDYIKSKIEDALKFREQTKIYNEHTNGLRILSGESEGLPGIVIDAFADTWVIKIYTACWLPYLRDILEVISSFAENPDKLNHACMVPNRMILRFGRECKKYYENAGFHEACLIYGKDNTPYAIFKEHDAIFQAQVFKGQKTGFFLDQRNNRQIIRSLAKDKKVLDICCYSGGFSLNAAIGGAHEVWSLDGDKHALDLVQKHYELNESDTNVAHSQHILQKSDMFDWLSRAFEKRMKFDLIIADPPSFASSQSQIPAAEKAYGRLFSAAANLLRPGGQLLCCSCSSHIGSEKFTQIVKKSLLHKTREAIDYTGLPEDHVAHFAEARYLKAWLIRC